ncbi:hypothetical protein EHS86_16680 [Erwinia amylovora]|nr:hypothetical protein AD997_02650 [Erwinia amylovora]RWS36904.1 hypothetical protein EHS86_16680 [Erwinia amylovora]
MKINYGAFLILPHNVRISATSIRLKASSATGIIPPNLIAISSEKRSRHPPPAMSYICRDPRSIRIKRRLLPTLFNSLPPDSLQRRHGAAAECAAS